MGTSTDLVTTAEAAQILDSDVSTVNRWAVEGRLRVAYRMPGAKGARLYLRAEVEAFAAELDAQRPPKCPTCGQRMPEGTQPVADVGHPDDEPEPNGATKVA